MDAMVYVSFEYETAGRGTTTWLGVDRGIYNLASLAVISRDGSGIEQINVDGRELRHVQRQHEHRQQRLQRSGRRYSGRSRRSIADEAVHTAANTIVELASRHRAQVVLENLSGLTFRGAKRKRSNFNRVLNRMQMAKLQQVLDYKLPVAGLPKPKTVSAAWTSQTCPRCGRQDKANRPKFPDPAGDGFVLDEFMCIACGYAYDADLNAARIIGMKKVWRDTLPAAQKSKLMSELSEDYSFRTFLRDRAERRDAARDGGSARANSTSGGRDAAAGPDQPPLYGAAEQGFAPAQLNLGILYDQGYGVAPDAAEATQWFRAAAEQGVPEAQFFLGALYENGEGVPKDAAEAARWYRAAAEQGDADAQFNLAALYEVGQGVPRDPLEAYIWMSLSAVHSPPGPERDEALARRYEIAAGMSPQARAEAEANAAARLDSLKRFRP